ncbi:MAG: hypothetical protein ACI9C3_003019, partial [Yoonia sp.]
QSMLQHTDPEQRLARSFCRRDAQDPPVAIAAHHHNVFDLNWKGSINLF